MLKLDKHFAFTANDDGYTVGIDVRVTNTLNQEAWANLSAGLTADELHQIANRFIAEARWLEEKKR